jgi:hypothetical protein
MRASIPFSRWSKKPRQIRTSSPSSRSSIAPRKNSRIISALIRAAQAGKHVTVLVELKARFDEARNLERANDLINAGAQIIYGVAGLKTHAKVCLVMRRESGHMTRYMHFGTGNYNESTSKLYTDISLLTCRAEFGADASAFFNTVTGRSRFVHFNKLSMAPYGLRERLVSLIRSETERARQGEVRRDHAQDERSRRPPDDRGALRSLPGRREGPPQRSRHLLPASRHQGHQRKHQRRQHHRPPTWSTPASSGSARAANRPSSSPAPTS